MCTSEVGSAPCSGEISSVSCQGEGRTITWSMCHVLAQITACYCSVCHIFIEISCYVQRAWHSEGNIMYVKRVCVGHCRGSTTPLIISTPNGFTGLIWII
ncbi:unnamed protein product [Cuscuta epithymum]|uniref:Uncharacterized protein n=1 Tax=Cuscuta epithymum TaxID=186058 RepID=A0AAV0CXT4_9ASTE|nr:unnamed protein product [Cuscuta epithymum]